MTKATGYTHLQIALHWVAALLIVQQYLIRDAITTAWEATTDGLESTFKPLVPAHVAGGALHHHFLLKDGLINRVLRAES